MIGGHLETSPLPFLKSYSRFYTGWYIYCSSGACSDYSKFNIFSIEMPRMLFEAVMVIGLVVRI